MRGDDQIIHQEVCYYKRIARSAACGELLESGAKRRRMVVRRQVLLMLQQLLRLQLERGRVAGGAVRSQQRRRG